MSVKCWLCDKESIKKNIFLRSKKETIINHCTECNFEFFETDNFRLLSTNQLDKTRLESAGLDIPKQEKDFQNGYEQSQSYIQEYLTSTDKGANILEIGCSWGYFLKAIRDFGAIPYGLEINPVRCDYVIKELNIRCEHNLELYQNSSIKFKKIFSFYCLEYIKNPINFFKQLIQLLDADGEIIFITPNLDDVLKNVWSNEAYKNFFYDECAIAYYSFKSVNSLASNLSKKYPEIDCTIKTQQGYSIYNHLHWFFNQKPINNNCLVGGDKLVQDIDANIVSYKNGLGESVKNLIHEFNKQYVEMIEKHNLGNQIVIRVKKC
jgi:hypothetical protein